MGYKPFIREAITEAQKEVESETIEGGKPIKGLLTRRLLLLATEFLSFWGTTSACREHISGLALLPKG